MPSGKVDAFYCGGRPGGTVANHDVYVLRAEAENCSGYGFDPHEQTHRLLIADCVAHHNKLDGFVADFVVDGEYRNNLAYANDRHGFNIVTSTNDFLMSGNVARDNLGGGIVVQRGSENIASPQNIVIEGGEVFGNALEGVLVKMANDVVISGVDIHGNGRDGVRLYGGANVSVIGNDIHDNSQSLAGGYSSIRIASYDDTGGASGRVFKAEYNLVAGNIIDATGAISAKYAHRGTDRRQLQLVRRQCHQRPLQRHHQDHRHLDRRHPGRWHQRRCLERRQRHRHHARQRRQRQSQGRVRTTISYSAALATTRSMVAPATISSSVAPAAIP